MNHFTLPLFLLKLLAFGLFFFTPIFVAMVATITLILIDMGTAIYAAYKAGEKITSRKMSVTISKLLLYNIAIITGHIAELYFLPIIPFVKIIIGVICLTELKSIFENIYKVTGTNFYNKIKDFLSRSEKTKE